MRVLVCAALRSEALPLLARLRGGRRAGPRARAGRWAGHEVIIAVVGVGAARACDGAAALLADGPAFDLVVSAGTCGGVGDGIAVGDVLTAERLLAGEPLRPAAALPPRPLPGMRPVVLATVPRPVLRPDHRAEVARGGAAAVEMEAAGVASAAAAAGVAFAAAKVVSDLAGGARDPALGRGLRRVRMGIFLQRTARLVHGRLAPALGRALAGLDAPPPSAR